VTPTQPRLEVASPEAVERMAFASYQAAAPRPGPDARMRHPELGRALLDALGRPERTMPCLLVAGSKGKGSSARLLARLLEASGEHVGLLTSPHLLDFRERIRVDGRAIEASALVHAGRLVAPPLAVLLERVTAPAYVSPTAVVLALALCHFSAQRCSVAVLECGRGARFDDVAQVAAVGAILTIVHREHALELGPTLIEIAWHKAGAIPERGWAVVAPQQAAVVRALRAEAVARGAALLEYGRDYEVHLHREALEGSLVSLRAGTDEVGPVELALPGRHQALNAAAALMAARAWRGQPLAPEQVAAALAGVRWPGRLEAIAERPRIVVDGAVSGVAARAMARLLRAQGRPHVVLLALSRGKDARGVVAGLSTWADRWVLARAANPHLRWDSRPWKAAVATGLPATRSSTVAGAIAQARRYAGPAGTVALAGTQSAVADALRWAGRDLAVV
jgi:dihydrofolate synthase/folylpolyglutamate synthase